MTIPVDERMARLEGSYEQIRDRLNSIDGRLASIDARFVQMDGRFAQVDGRFAQIDGRFAALEAKIDSRFSWLLGIVVTSWVTTILTILFHR
jgi:predicted nuclease with TOPRIM domain